MDAKCGMKCGGQLWARVAKIILFFPFLLAFDVEGLGFEFCVFVAGWRHALQSEWPFIIITVTVMYCRVCAPWTRVVRQRLQKPNNLLIL